MSSLLSDAAAVRESPATGMLPAAMLIGDAPFVLIREYEVSPQPPTGRHNELFRVYLLPTVCRESGVSERIADDKIRDPLSARGDCIIF
jgi:hypothetical protein